MIIRLDLQAWAHDLKSTVHAHRGEATIRAQHGLRDLANESRVKSQAARDVLDHLHSYRGTLIDPRPVQSWLDAKVVGAEGVERSMFELFRRDLNGYLIAVEEPRSFRVAYRIGRKVGRFVRRLPT